MATKTLTAKVKLDTKSAEASLARLSKKIANVQTAINRTAKGNTKLTTAINSAVTATNKLNTATNKVKTTTERVATTTKKVRTANELATQSAKQLGNAYRASNTAASGLLTTVKRLAATYLGVMGAKAMINTSDTITSTQNRLNNLNGGDTSLTQDQMDTMYSSANKVRMSYKDMLSNASKSMTLAGGAFQGDMNNAIRFQEIMAETYALGGASAAEMSSSMYQMIQALGAGILAGDELRSVREGAPLAYQAIEKFAQGVLNSEESLKELASQGKVTSEMVVAAIMDAGSDIDKAFEKTYWTFGQAWDRIKNSAIKAFEPVSNMLNKLLNDAANNGAFEKIEQAFVNISEALQIAFQVIYNAISWIAENWSWLQHLLIGGLILYISYLLVVTGISIYNTAIQIAGWISQYGWIMVVVAAVMALIYVFYLWKTGAIDTCQAIVSALLIVGVAVALIGLLIGNTTMVIVGLVIAAIGLIINYLDYFLAVLYSIVSFIWNLLVTLAINIIKNVILSLTLAWDNFANFFGNLFNDPISAIIRCFEKLADSVLSILQTIATGIDAIFGSNLASAVQGWRSGLSSAANKLVDKYGNGTYEEKSNMTKQVEEVLDSVQGNLLWNTSDAWNTGMSHGAAAQDWLNGVGSKFQNGFGDLSLDNIAGSLGLNLTPVNFNGGGDTSGAYTLPDNLGKNVGSINDNTGSIADAMELTNDELELLRKVADMEWKKEFTTATITVDMSNYNTISGESDLDGIVTKLTEKLTEELHILADGVYA